MALDAPQTVGLHTLSAHSASGYNGVNPGLYALWPNGAALGAYHNSYRRNSTYVGWLWQIDRANRFGVLLGGATGYGSTTERMPIAPLVVPSVRWEPSRGMYARLSFFPDPRKGAVQVLHLSFEWTLAGPAR
jgi:hypothetical protein